MRTSVAWTVTSIALVSMKVNDFREYATCLDYLARQSVYIPVSNIRRSNMATDITLQEASIAFLEHLKAQGKHERTLYTYGQDLKQIQAFFGSERSVQKITLPFIGRFLKSDELLKLSNGNNRAPQTIKKTIRVFRMLMLWLHQEEYLTELHLPKSLSKG
jgi:hypothetical protein